MATVNAGGNLQAALDAAVSGGDKEIILEAGATWTGTYTLPSNTGVSPITVKRSGSQPSAIPMTGAGLATIATTSNGPALRTLTNSSHWRFSGIQFRQASGTGSDIVRLGDGLINTEPALPRDFIFDYCLFQNDSQAVNGMQMNAADVTIRNCAVRGVKYAGVESHAIIVWNAPGPYLVEDCYLEAGSCGFFVGGAGPAITNLVPSNIVFRRNTTTRPIALKSQTGWAIKNLFELKNARNVEVYGNIFENNWPDSQSGWSIVFTVRANSPNAAWTIIEHVLFRDNIVRHVPMGFNILGLDDQVENGQVYPSQPMNDVVIQNNLLWDVDRVAWAGPTGQTGSGSLMQINGGPRNLHVINNTMWSDGNIMNLVGNPIPGFVYQNNIVRKLLTPFESYGVFGNAVGEGNAALNAFAPNVQGYPNTVFTGNVLAGTTASVYNQYAGNFHPTAAAMQSEFVNPSTGNFRLNPGSTYAGKGADLDVIDAAIAGATPITMTPTSFTLVVGTPVSTTIVADGGDGGPYTFSVVAGALPAGLSLNGTSGLLSGTPTTQGSYNFTVRASDGTDTGDRAYSGTVAPDTAPPDGDILISEAVAIVNEWHATGISAFVPTMGGTVSPQAAAVLALTWYRDQLVSALEAAQEPP